MRKSGSDAHAIGIDVGAALVANMWHPAVSTANFNDISVTPLDGSSATVKVSMVPYDSAGSTSGAWSPASAAVVSIQTAKRGRSYRGRLYIPFIGEAAISDGSLVSGQADDVLAGFTSFKAALTTAGVEWVVASYKHSTAELVTGFYVMSQLGTQRRRQTRVRYP
jgi:hypothetical protein